MKNGITHENRGLKVEELSEEQISNLTEVYVCPSFSCNLKCPHCTLKDIKMPYNIDAVCHTLRYLLDKSPKLMYFTLFGGEPLILPKDAWDKLEPLLGEKEYSISTNLINLNEENIQHLKRCIMPDTSWNPLRFGDPESVEQEVLYWKWRHNLLELQKANIKFEVMVTLTKDLITNYTPEQFIKECSKWSATLVRFEQMIGDDTLDFNDVDNWLLGVYYLWNSDLCGKNVMFSKLANVARGTTKWAEHCESTFTILPDGNVKQSCPYFETKVVKADCMTCEYGDVCKGGCPLQEHCTFPKQTYEQIKKDLDIVDDSNIDSLYAGSSIQRCMCK